ncbi:anaerobic ribonucleoside-triphosphate reductase [Sporomusa acidovorans]|uniref:Uncharacterized protein n=1 Tax=Sporomusa acidovorans (strain ATCC 49682 / DSM 3132 / Mol) TaxID=1123286 RepID=A0ABZ3J3X8_SPOA4|nr:anaerobic ribonucleoside-triphosphate reductase [Sporomusa acidovorans]OZC20273.1 anaerobic ribonucleoside triphosphate reductase [Sporomusa acidovorans DSM 3132]SDD39631.1 Anaerobic ribonucleoside-triphosphate reductase [Sporomusa acidovorans]
MLINGIKVIAEEGIVESQLQDIVAEEQKLWGKKGKKIAKIELTIDGQEVVVKTTERSPITRTRRITGYLSTVDRFNDAKVAELNARVVHV